MAPSIVNGLSTEDFAPVVKLTMGSQYHGMNASKNLCTGTFIGEGLILTAAHCLTRLHFQVLNFKFNYLVFDQEISLVNTPSIMINDEKESRAKRIVFHPHYLDVASEENSLLETILHLKSLVDKSELDMKEARGLVQRLKKIINIKKSAKMQEFDLAIIQVEPREGDQFYPVYQGELSKGEKITAVGFGDGKNTDEIDRLKEEASGYLSLARAKVNEEENFEKYKEVGKKLSHLASGEKRFGVNTVSEAEDGKYTMVGVSQNLKLDLDGPPEFFEKGKAGEEVSLSRGDSGGPLLVEKQGRIYVAGVASTVFYHELKDKIISTYASLSSESSLDFISSVLPHEHVTGNTNDIGHMIFKDGNFTEKTWENREKPPKFILKK